MSDNWHLGLPGVKSPDAEERIQCSECGSFFNESEFSSWEDGAVCNGCYQEAKEFRGWVKSGKGNFKASGTRHGKYSYTVECVVCGEIKEEGQMSLDDPNVCDSCTVYAY